MATTKIWAVRDRLKRVVDYVKNPDKTEIEDDLYNVLEYASNDKKTHKQLYVSGVNCNPEHAYKQMLVTKKSANKMNGVQAYHAYQSFKPGEVDAKGAHEIGIELAKLMWGNEFEVIVCTHTDKNHLHNHFVVNSVSFKTHKSFTNKHADYRRFMMLSDGLCYEHSLSVLNSNNRGISRGEYHVKKKSRLTNRDLICNDVEYCISKSDNWHEFTKNMEDMGYRFKYGKHIAVYPYFVESKHPYRLYKISQDEKYSEENIRYRLISNKKYNRQVIHVVQKRYKGDFDNTRKLTGYKALYFRFLYMLGVLPKKQPTYTVHKKMKKELLKVDLYTEEVLFLSKHKMDSLEDLNEYRTNLIANKEALVQQRYAIYNKMRRAKGDDNDELFLEKEKLTKEIKKLNKQINICDRIEKNTKEMEDKLREITFKKEEKQAQEKEMKGRDL